MNPPNNSKSFIPPRKWKINTSESHDTENGWTAYEPYDKCLTWEFKPERTTKYPDGTDEYSGILTEWFADGRKEEKEYYFYKSESQLYIDRSIYTPEGFTDFFFNDRYRIVAGKNNEYILYDLDEVESEPDDYYGRIIITPIN